MTELSNEHTYILRYDSERGGAMCATRTGIGSRIELQPLVPELIDVQGWVLDHLDGSTYRIIDPTAYDDSKEYGITEPAEIGPPNAVSLGDPSEFNFTTGRGEPTKYSMGESVLLLTAASNASHARRSSLSVSLPGTPAAATGPGVTVRSRGSLPGKVQRLGGVELGGAEGLVLALSALKDKGGPNVDLSVRAVTVSLSPLPTKPPVLVLVPLEAHDTLTTPSAICFVPPMGASWSRPEPQPSSAPRRPRPVSSIELSGTTSAAAVERVIAHVKRVVGELTGTGIPVVAYTPSTAPLPSQIVGALEDAGCKGVLAPPFSPDSVRATLTKVRPWSKVQPAVITLEPISSPRIVPAAPIHAPKPSLSLASLPSTSYTPQPESSTSQMSTLPALAPLVPPPPHLAARASYSCPHIYAPALPPCVRRRSVDVGGLALALSGAGHGGGWGGWAGAEEELALGISAKAKGKAKAEPKILGQDAMYAELLSQMYTQTGATVEGATSDAPSHPYSGRPHSVSDPHIPFAYTVDTPPSTPKRADVTDPAHREHLISLLDRWEFEPHKLSDEDVLGCASLLFEAAFEVEGMQEDVGVQFDQLPPFLRAVRKIYRTQNQYHNFQHALDVFQAVYWFLCRAGVVPPVKVLSKNGSHEEGQFVNGQNFIPLDGKWRRSKTQGRIGILRNVDVFALLLAAVGHDVGHPGLSNAFMTNADTPLSRVFDHKSSLEQLHCALLLRLMHKYGMGHLLMSPRKSSSGLVSHASSPGLNATYQRQDSQNGDSLRQPHGFRWLLVQTVLATDMSVHFDWLGRFKAYTEKTGFSGSEDEERLMICQALIKCGDISNPTRPHAVSEHWSKVLLEEWACQATFEQELDLPVTVVNVDVANGAKQQAQGQVNFIDLFTQPLFSATANAIPQLHPITEQCALNRKLWQARMEQLSQATPTAPPRPRTTSGVGSTQEAHYRSIFPLSLPPALSAQPPAVTRPSSSGSASTVGAGSLFSPTGSTSSVASGGMTSGKHTAEPSAVRVAYKASVRKKKSFHRVSWPAPVPAPPPLPMPSPLGEQST